MDFSLVLLVFVAITGLVSLGYWLLFERARVAARGAERVVPDGSAPRRAQPVLVEYARALFPVVLAVFLLRSFVVEPFRIPSGSMLPSLYVGDFILVNKFTYGIRLPVIHRKVFEMGSPARGDVMVFRYPKNPDLNFIKRVVGLPGDVIAYRGKKLFINGEVAPRAEQGHFRFDPLRLRGRAVARYRETIGDSDHAILIDPDAPGLDMEVTVPAGRYFVMGDNRDHSNDSRYWRFVPERNVVGKAFFIWFSWKSAPGAGVRWSRIGDGIE
ncbi:MAG: signal peptidase I [bacterium]